MSLSIATKGIIGIISASTLGGASYGAYSYFNSSTTSVKEALIKNGKTVLNFDATKGQEDFEEWEELAKQYYENKLRGKKEISGFSIASAKNVVNLQAKCKALLDSNSKSQNYDRDLADAKDWCTKESAPRAVSKILKEKNKVLLTGTSNENWGTQWKAFQNKYKGKELPKDWSFDNWKDKQNQQTIQEELKTKCTANSKESLIPIRDEAFISQIISFCTKDND